MAERPSATMAFSHWGLRLFFGRLSVRLLRSRHRRERKGYDLKSLQRTSFLVRSLSQMKIASFDVTGIRVMFAR